MKFLCLLIFLIPFQNHPLLSMSIGPKITPIKVIGIFVLILGLRSLFMTKDAETKPRLLGQGYFFLIFCFSQFLLSVLWFPKVGDDAMRSFFSFLVFFIAVSSLVRKPEDLRLVFWTCLVAMAWSSIYMYKEYFQLRHVYAGFRPRGSFGDSNYFCIAAVTVSPMGISLFNTHKGRARLVAGAMVVFMLGAIMISQSRGGILGALVIGALYILSSRNVVRSVILGAFCLWSASLFMPDNFWERMKKTEIKETNKVAGDDLSNKRRIELPRAGILMFQDNPILGVGPGNYKDNSAKYNPILWELNGPGIAHNTFVEILAELGLFGTFCFLGMNLLSVTTLNRLVRRHPEDIEFAQMAKAIKIGLYAFFASAVFLSAEFSKFYWLAIFLTSAMERVSRGKVSTLVNALAEKTE